MTHRLGRFLVALALPVALVACSDDVAPGTDPDVTTLTDAGADADIDVVDPDAGSGDVEPDADIDRALDADADTDAGAGDAGRDPGGDAGTPDALADAVDDAADAAVSDADVPDSAAPDAASSDDAGPDTDAAVPDATPDAGTDTAGYTAAPDAGVDAAPDAQPDTSPAPTCDDGIRNGDEVAVDCGGACVPDGAPTLDDVWNDVIATDCGGCHTGTGRSGGFGLGVNDGGVLDRLLARSVDVPSMPYITPCDVDRSYFWHKCAGTQTSVGGSGRRMPTRGSLTTEQLDLLRAWIEAGAPE